jgi:hypothetical protein
MTRTGDFSDVCVLASLVRASRKMFWCILGYRWNCWHKHAWQENDEAGQRQVWILVQCHVDFGGLEVNHRNLQWWEPLWTPYRSSIETCGRPTSQNSPQRGNRDDSISEVWKRVNWLATCHHGRGWFGIPTDNFFIYSLRLLEPNEPHNLISSHQRMLWFDTMTPGTFCSTRWRHQTFSSQTRDCSFRPFLSRIFGS